MRKFKCSQCGGTQVEEVMKGVTQYATIEDVEIICDELVPTYGLSSYDGGDVDDVFYQCSKCHLVVTEQELRELVDKQEI